MRRFLVVAFAMLLTSASLPGLAVAQSEAAGSTAGQTSLVDYEQAQDTGVYNTDYLFALSRGLGDSSLHPAAKVPLFIFTVPLDLALLPFAAIGGFFG